VECPRKSRRIVGDVEDYRVGVICDRRCPNNMERGAIVDYNHHKFQYVDRHEHAVVIAGFESGCTLNHFVRETNVPPESQGSKRAAPATMPTSGLKVLWGVFQKDFYWFLAEQGPLAQKRKNRTGKFKGSLPGN
jgi:hypothetical protein